MSIEALTGAESRTSARVVLLAPDDTVLHMGGDRCRDGVPRWFTPGGGVEDGEDLPDAAIREVHEETGLRIDREALTGPIAYGVYVCFPHGRLLVQKNWYFFHRVERFAPRMVGGAGYELGLGFDWLPIGALGSSDGMIEPDRLVSLVKRLQGGDVPATPVDLGGSHGPVFPDWD